MVNHWSQLKTTWQATKKFQNGQNTDGEPRGANPHIWKTPSVEINTQAPPEPGLSGQCSFSEAGPPRNQVPTHGPANYAHNTSTAGQGLFSGQVANNLNHQSRYENPMTGIPAQTYGSPQYPPEQPPQHLQNTQGGSHNAVDGRFFSPLGSSSHHDTVNPLYHSGPGLESQAHHQEIQNDDNRQWHSDGRYSGDRMAQDCGNRPFQRSATDYEDYTSNSFSPPAPVRRAQTYSTPGQYAPQNHSDWYQGSWSQEGFHSGYSDQRAAHGSSGYQWTQPTGYCQYCGTATPCRCYSRN